MKRTTDPIFVQEKGRGEKVKITITKVKARETVILLEKKRYDRRTRVVRLSGFLSTGYNSLLPGHSNLRNAIGIEISGYLGSKRGNFFRPTKLEGGKGNSTERVRRL